MYIRTNAQILNEKRSSYLGIHLGPAKYLGDLNNTNKLDQNIFFINNSNFFYGAFFRRNYRRSISVDFQFSIGKLSASDKDNRFKNTTEASYLRYRRNLEFRSNISEGGIVVKYKPLQSLIPKYHYAKLAPYFLSGAGVFRFNPQGLVYNSTINESYYVNLRDYSTEGQGFKETGIPTYALTQINLFYGGGLQWQVSEFSQIDFSIHGRKLFTDHLDDVSGAYIDPTLYSKYYTLDDLEAAEYVQDKSVLLPPFIPANPGTLRGNPKKMDGYFNYDIKFCFKIGQKKIRKNPVIKFDDNELCSRY